MSCRIGVCTTTSAYLLTDAAAMAPRQSDGVLVSIEAKQACVIPRGPQGQQGVVAIMGWNPPVRRFIAQARECCTDFDTLVDMTPRLWRQIRSEMPPPPGWSYSGLLSGWSERRQQVEMYELDSRWPPTGAEIVVHVTGASVNDDDASQAFLANFGENPDAFDPHTDGIAFFEEMRRHTRQFQIGPPRHYVGGYIQATRLTGHGAESAIIHRWADRVGELIHIDVRETPEQLMPAAPASRGES